MSEPDVDPDDTIFKATGANTGKVVHLKRDCKALQRASNVREMQARQFPNPKWCSYCLGNRTHGGGSREIYELAKQAGQNRAEVQDES